MRNVTKNKSPLDVQKEKEVFLYVQPEFVDNNQPSTYRQVNTIPELFEHLLRKKTLKKVSNIKEFFKICLALINDKDVVTELETLIEETLDYLHPKKRVNLIEKELKIGQEL